MRWATTHHQTLKTWLIATLQVLPDEDHDSIPKSIKFLIFHPFLAFTQTLAEKVMITKLIIHSAFIKITNIQLQWNSGILLSFQDTTTQEGDEQLLRMWKRQWASIHQSHEFGHFSGIPGDLFEGLVQDNISLPENFQSSSHLPASPHEPHDDDDIVSDVENILSNTMLSELIQEGGVQA